MKQEAWNLQSDSIVQPIRTMIQKDYNSPPQDQIKPARRFVSAKSTNIHQEKLESILANAVDAIITINHRGIVESVNPATQTLFGFSAEEIVGNNIDMLMPQPDRDKHDGYLRNYFETGIKKIIGIGREVVGQRKNGSTFPMHLAVSEIQFEGKTLFTGICRDISDVKVAEQQLSEANERLEDRVRERTQELKQAQADLLKSEKLATLGQVAGGIAHEIRNPLNAVKTSAYFLLHANDPSVEKVKEHLDRIDRQVTMIDNVITALSDVAKLPDANIQPTDLPKLLRSVTQSVSMPSSINVDFDFSHHLPFALIDENQLPIAFRNLLRNARDAMPEGGNLIVGAAWNGDHIEAYFQDDGIGISKENLPKVLEPMFTTKARGMGLGLAITRAILEKNHCRITIASEEGAGSRFVISIPAEAKASHDK